MEKLILTILDTPNETLAAILICCVAAMVIAVIHYDVMPAVRRRRS